MNGSDTATLAVDALADELLAAVNAFPVDRPFSRDPARGEPEHRLCKAYNRLYCELHDKGETESRAVIGSDTARQRLDDLMLEFRIIAEQGGGEAVARRELCQRLVALLERVASLEAALRRIEHYPFAVASNDAADLRAIKDIAHDALAAVGVPPEQTPK